MRKPTKTTLLSIAILAFLSSPQSGFATDPHDVPAHEETTGDPQSNQELVITLQAPLMSPLFSKTPVAVVDEEPITFSDLTKLIASIHAGRAAEATAARKDYANLLERLIRTKLIIQEARNIGLDELPEIQSQIDQLSIKLLAAALMSPKLETVEADAAEVDALYEQMSRELLLTALTFKREEDALAFQEQYRSGGDFTGLARRFIEAGRAEGDIDVQQYTKLKDLLPQIAQAAFEMDADSISPIFTADGGFILFYLDDIRFYEDATVKEEARQKILTPLKRKKADDYVDFLIEEYSTINRDLLDEVDFETQKTGYLWSREEQPVDHQQLLDDDRVLAIVHGDEPFTVTVGDLAGEVERKRFHGVEEAAQKRGLNKKKWPVLRDVLFRRIVRIEAASQGKDQTEEYLDAIGEYTHSLLFDTFVRKIVAPDVKISEEEVRDYYAEHADEFSSPTMFRMSGLAFHTLPDAERALMKLRRGVDFKWVSANSPGQVDKETEETLNIDDSLLSLTALPDDLRKTAEGAQAGDSLLYSSPENHHYVIAIEEVFPARPKPYEAVRRSIAGIIFEEKVKALLDEWGGKLKEAYETRIFLSGFNH